MRLAPEIELLLLLPEHLGPSLRLSIQRGLEQGSLAGWQPGEDSGGHTGQLKRPGACSSPGLVWL